MDAVPRPRSTGVVVPIRSFADGMALERTDYFEIAGAKYSARVAALFKVTNGKISYWVDYFDGNAFAPIGTLMGALAKK